MTTASLADDPRFAGLFEAARALQPRTVALRRQLHKHPELGLDLPRTQAAVLHALEGLGLHVSTGESCSSVIAVLNGDKPGPTVLLRGDMDALPLQEDSGLAFASETDGSMHACGHDTHTAMLVSAARLLHSRRDALAGQVVFMFQPGEEGHHGARLHDRGGRARGGRAAGGAGVRAAHHVDRAVRGGDVPAGADHGERRRVDGDRHRQGRARRDAVPTRSTRCPRRRRWSARCRRW